MTLAAREVHRIFTKWNFMDTKDSLLRENVIQLRLVYGPPANHDSISDWIHRAHVVIVQIAKSFHGVWNF